MCCCLRRSNVVDAAAVLVSIVCSFAAEAQILRQPGGALDQPAVRLEFAQASPPTWPRPPANAAADPLRDQIRQAIRLYQSGRCVDAIPLAQAVAIAIRERSGTNHPDLIAAVNIRALCHKALGQYDEAEPLYREAVQLAEQAYGAEATEVAIMLDNLAGLYFEQHRLTLSEPLRRRALEIFLKSTGPESANTLTSTQNLGALLHSQGKFAEAERLYRQALVIAEKIYRPDNPQLARLLDNLAGAVRSQDRLVEAGPLYERAVAIFETSLGPEHPDTALALQNHAILLSEQGQYAASEAQIKRARATSGTSDRATRCLWSR